MKCYPAHDLNSPVYTRPTGPASKKGCTPTCKPCSDPPNHNGANSPKGQHLPNPIPIIRLPPTGHRKRPPPPTYRAQSSPGTLQRDTPHRPPTSGERLGLCKCGGRSASLDARAVATSISRAQGASPWTRAAAAGKSGAPAVWLAHGRSDPRSWRRGARWVRWWR